MDILDKDSFVFKLFSGEYFELVILAFLIVFIICMIGGIIKTFQRQPIVAILCIIFLFPAYIIWAFIELFTEPINRSNNNNSDIL